MRYSVIEIEKIILKELGFELYRIVDHPHKLMQHYLKLLKASNEVARKAWNYLNDSYRTSLCVHYPPSTLAASCIYLSLRSLSIPMPNKAWWVLMESSISQIHDICAEVLNLYRQPKLCLKDIKDIIEDSCKSLKIEINFSFAFDEFFNSEEFAQTKLSENEELFLNNNAPSKNSNIFGKNNLNKDVNSTSSTIKELNKNENLSSDPLKKSKSHHSKTKSKSPTPKKESKKHRDERKRHSKKHKYRERSRTRSKSHRHRSSSSESSSSSRSSSRYHRKNKDVRKKKRRSSVERKKRRRSSSSNSKRNSSKNHK